MAPGLQAFLSCGSEQKYNCTHQYNASDCLL